MRIRGKFTKEGQTKFVGHLDTVRLFQRAIKTSGLPIAYSEGFNPHSKVYFAMPLSVGVSSEGEYIEIKTTQDVDLTEAKVNLNKVLPQGIKVDSFKSVPSEAPTLMSQVDVADYTITINTNEDLTDMLKSTLDQNEIITTKQNKKKKIVEIDIKPLIISYDVCYSEKLILKVRLYTGSKQNLSPDLLVKCLLGEKYDYDVHRTELYSLSEYKLVALSELV
ncbi:hypothetical protein AN639_03595 [Candidatus Epulonipiscium fishelsonii]|uniref:Uncharacterized protein n=1 Tax=Candidatus Epulonipiscium fishelsonii TaxID=77094 RepID=A0ACC8XDM3_9FIRM|nr:hypothetical protein AN396_00770 [Epulopiscium sp. SCG-B11WGA-EpuloA1]ONI41502.1 hypothetical protein AN639_03595 [Epulopiscium sp. SCG-B05WGA-EpuloA1]